MHRPEDSACNSSRRIKEKKGKEKVLGTNGNGGGFGESTAQHSMAHAECGSFFVKCAQPMMRSSSLAGFCIRIRPESTVHSAVESTRGTADTWHRTESHRLKS